MSTVRLLERVIQVSIPPILSFESRGRQGDIRVDVSARGHMILASEPSAVTLYNLNENTRRALSQSSAICNVKAGYVGVPLMSLTSSNIYFVESARSGGDIATTLHLWPLYRQTLQEEVIEVTYREGTRVADILTYIADSKQIPIKRDVVNHVSGTIGPGGFSFQGNAENLINRLGEEYAFSANIQHGVLQAIDDGKAYSTAKTTLDESTGLISCQYAVPNPFYKVASASIVSMFRPTVLPGSLVHVDSRSARIKRDFIVTAIEYNVSSHDVQWEMNITSEFYDEYTK